MKQLLLMVLVVYATNLHAKNYYVSASGNDTNDGLTTATPWKSIAKVNSFNFAANDYILFKRGDTFYGGIVIKRANLYFDAYGTGLKPVISGLSTVTGWVNLGGNIWEAPTSGVSATVNLVLRNNVPQQVGRYPNTDATNSGYLTYTASTSTSITGTALSSVANWTGAEVAIRVNRWTIKRAKVTGHSSGAVSFATMSPTPKVNFGYFFQRDSRTLDKDGEWWYDNINSKLRVYSTVNPSTYTYKISTVDDLLYSVYGSISISNLVFEGAGKRAIRFSGSGNINISNCDVINSGGEGISTNSSEHVTVDNCNTKNCLGSGIRINCPFSGLKMLTIKNCNVDSTAMIAGMEISDDVNGGEGILCKGGDGVLVLNNTVTNSGYNGIEWQGNDVYIKYNFVSKFCCVRDDGSGIYTMEGPGSSFPTRKNRNLISNIVTNGIGALNGTDGGTSESAISGLYFDLGSRVILVDSNTIANVNGNSFHGNSNASLTFKNNTFYGNSSSFSLQRFNDAPLVRNIILKKNILYPYRMRYRNLALDLPSLTTKESDLKAMNLIDSNYYSLRAGKDTSITCVTTNSNLSNYAETAHNFAYITSTLGFELHSTNVVNTGTLEYNASNTPKIVSFPGLSRKDVFGNIYNNFVTIPAWSSKVLIANSLVPTSNIPPISNAGMNQSVTLPENTINLFGTATDNDGTISNYIWEKISGPIAGNILSPNAATTAVNNLVIGIYQFELTVTDNNGATDKDTVQVTVNIAANLTPSANAGNDQSITLPINSTSLTGNGTDADGTISSYAWIKISGPASGTIVAPNAAITALNNLVQGVFKYELTVTDNKGAKAKDTVQVMVNAAGNLTPIASAGSDKTITLPINMTNLTGSGTDADGTISSYAWVKISGPASGTIVAPKAANTAVNNLTLGIFKYELTVTDNNGAKAKDTVQVTVNAAVNLAPIANAGSDKTITLPINTTSLTGSGADADGTISSYAWVKISGPASGTIVAPKAANTAVNNLTQGIFKYELTVTDNNGAKAKDTVQVTVNAAVNLAPIANAGSDKTITLPINTTSLTGSGADTDGTISSYAWVKISGPASGTIVAPKAANTAVNNLTQGIFKYELTVTDNKGAKAKDTVQVTVNAAGNQAPIANAGSDKTITLPINTTSLIGSGTDADGMINSYSWVKISGPASATLSTPNAATTTINNLVQGVFKYELTVTDNDGAKAKDTVQVTVNAAGNQAPVANAGNKKTITLPTNSTTLNGSGNDVDGTITSYAWAKLSGPPNETIAMANSASTAIDNLVQGIYLFELTVTDNRGDNGKDTVQVTVNPASNQAPTAKASDKKNITVQTSSYTLNGSGTDTDGTIISYSWAKVSGPAEGMIASPLEATTNLENLITGIYQFELTVTDDIGDIGKDTLELTVNMYVNLLPTANAGIDQSITLPLNTTDLSGSGNDPDGTISSYEWVKISGPDSGSIAATDAATTSINNLVPGVYELELTVTDNNGATGKDTMLIMVNPAPNEAPSANAGVDVSITLPIDYSNLVGSGSDVDGVISSYNWVKISGPGSETIANPNAATSSVHNLIQGVYEFELTVTDDYGATGKDTVFITVNPSLNKAPIANAGADQSITLPIDYLNLIGSGSDVDGVVSRYTWLKISGPASGNISNTNAATTLINNLTQGFYQFELTVTDNIGATGKDTVFITVNPALNKAPIANAGADQSITLPIDYLNLIGSGSDVDGVISSYNWVKISGPASETIANPNAANSSVHNLIQGVYEFELTVTDDHGATGKDTVFITVNPALNKAPIANAGADQSITLPIDYLNLIGSGSDVDGVVSRYTWLKISGPASGNISNTNAATTLINNLTQGFYQFELTVTDNIGATGKDTVFITVNPALNKAPIANAGADQSITLPIDYLNLIGSGSDVDGVISSYNWVKISGPASGTIANTNAATTSINNLIQGVYQFELTVRDNNGATGKDIVQVTVLAAAITNQFPIINAGNDISIILPENSVTLKSSGSDPDGSIISYSWKVVSGPAASIIRTPNLSETRIENLFQGVYILQVTVVDNGGAITRDSLSITVSSPRLSLTSSNQLKVYPNPVKDITNLNISTPIKNTKIAISVVNMAGMVVSAKEFVTTDYITNYKLDMSALTNGFYIITLKFDDGQILSSKVIKNSSK